MNDQVELYAPIVLSIFFHVHRHAELNLLPSAGMVELVVCAVVVAYFAYKHFSQEKSGQKGGMTMSDLGARQQVPVKDAAAAAAAAAAADSDSAPASNKKDEEPNKVVEAIKEHSRWALPLSNVLQAIYLDHLAASKSSRRQRGGKKRSRRSRSKSRRRRRSKKH